MRYQITINGKPEDVKILKSGSTISIERNGRIQTFAYQKTSSGYLLENEGRIYHTNLQTSGNEKAVVNVNDKSIPLIWKNPYQLNSGGGSSSNQNEIRSVMPGRVVKLLVKIGDSVKAGQPLLILEAMKMENEMKAPKEGTVSEIKISEGASVEAGMILIQLE